MHNILSERTFTAIGLIIVGFVGLIFGPLALGIGSLFAILFGIYSIVKKKFDAGIITIIIGIAIIVVSKYVNALIHIVSLASIIIGIVLFFYYYFIDKSKNNGENKNNKEDLK